MSEPVHHWRASREMQARARELRKDLTPAEKKLWAYLREGQLDGAHLPMSGEQRRWAAWRRKQHAVGTYIVDFFCARSKLVIEVDGDTHADQVEYDAQRTAWLNEQKHYRVLRFTNDDVHRNLDAVMQVIAAALQEPPP